MTKNQPKCLERAQLQALLSVPNVQCVSGLRNRVMLELMARCGLRIGEVRTLKLSSIRWESGILDVRGKGAKDRCVPFHSNTAEWLQKWCDTRPEGSEWLFCTSSGTQVSPRYLQAMVKRMTRKVGLPAWVTPHTLRHTYATQLLQEGFDIRMVQELLGHENLNTTMIYTHVAQVELARRIQERQI